MATYLIRLPKLSLSLVSEFLSANFGIDVSHFNPEVLIVNNFDNIKDIITLSDVKDVTSFAVTRPIRQSKKYIIFIGFEGATIEVQNKFLKLFEDSPVYLDILLFVADTSAVLDTVKSRCNIIYASGDIHFKQGEDIGKIKELLEGFSLGFLETMPQDMSTFLFHFRQVIQDRFKHGSIHAAQYNSLNKVLVKVQRYLKLNLNQRDIWRWFVLKVNSIVSS